LDFACIHLTYLKDASIFECTAVVQKYTTSYLFILRLINIEVDSTFGCNEQVIAANILVTVSYRTWARNFWHLYDSLS
jgi:hypothetical protein